MSKPSPLLTVTHIAAWKPLSQVQHRVRPTPAIELQRCRCGAASPDRPFVHPAAFWALSVCDADKLPLKQRSLCFSLRPLSPFMLADFVFSL
jgi:hypothetical protein